MGTVNGIFGLPGFPTPPLDDAEPSRSAVPRYFADFEDDRQLPIRRPVRVSRVEEAAEGHCGCTPMPVSGSPGR